ncbi:MAG: carboxypeptidase-like regulatory domain-containing protein, partial [Leeuwenhoekiella sp.]|nr:carboxypeptidase-like regulatory domain-containing protein [Leeuwenhoekiella sp.]
MRNTILFYIFLAPLALIAQEYDISSKVIDSKKKPVSFANILLLKAADSSFVKGTVSEDDGSFKFSDLEIARFLIKVSFVGYKDFYSTPIDVKDASILPPFTLQDSAEFLDEVTITAKRPVIQRKIDRLVFDVENTAISSGSTYDILKRTPGVIINQDQILVKNRPAQIYINDRKVYLTSQELQQLLEGFAGVNVKSVEVITTPPAKYDAEGGAILNIITSKNLSIGYKGSINASNTVGIVPKYAVGTSQYYKTDWLNAYASYTFNSRFDTKTDEGFVQFDNLDGSEKATWEDLFKRDTRT